MGRRCASCGAPISSFTAELLCPACYGTNAGTSRVSAPAREPARTAWLWIAPQAARALATRDLAVILRAYRTVNQLSQAQLAEHLGYDPAYISLIECGKRVISDRGSLTRIARQLAVPPHVLGVTDDDDADFAAMLQFADSVIRLAELTRRAGHAVEAVNELWPLIARLEARVCKWPVRTRCHNPAHQRPGRLRHLSRPHPPRRTTVHRRPLDRQGSLHRHKDRRASPAGSRPADARQRTPQSRIRARKRSSAAPGQVLEPHRRRMRRDIGPAGQNGRGTRASGAV